MSCRRICEANPWQARHAAGFPLTADGSPDHRGGWRTRSCMAATLKASMRSRKALSSTFLPAERKSARILAITPSSSAPIQAPERQSSPKESIADAVAAHRHRRAPGEARAVDEVREAQKPICILGRQNEGAPLVTLGLRQRSPSVDERRGVIRIDSLLSCLCEQVPMPGRSSVPGIDF